MTGCLKVVIWTVIFKSRLGYLQVISVGLVCREMECSRTDSKGGLVCLRVGRYSRLGVQG